MEKDNQLILSLLTELEKDPERTQKDLAVQLGVAVGLVNSYLKRIIYKGYVKTKHLDRRRLRYLLTPKGLREKTRLTFEFLQYSYQYIREVRKKVRQLLEPFAVQGKKRVLFYGSGEVAELAYLAVRELGMELITVIDPQREGHSCVDLAIQSPKWLSDHASPRPADVALILSPLNKTGEPTPETEKILQQLGIAIVRLE